MYVAKSSGANSDTRCSGRSFLLCREEVHRLPDVLEGRIEPGRVFDRTIDIDGVPDG
jgi:hypothetical protein